MKHLRTLSAEAYIRAHPDPVVRDILARYDRGDMDYIQALERCVVLLLDRLPTPGERPT